MAAIVRVHSFSAQFSGHHSNASPCGKISRWAVHTSRQHSAVCTHIQPAQKTTLHASKMIIHNTKFSSIIINFLYSQILLRFSVNFYVACLGYFRTLLPVSVHSARSEDLVWLCEGGWLVYRGESSRYDILLFTRGSYDSVTMHKNGDWASLYISSLSLTTPVPLCRRPKG